jgi:hypothetical protein
MTPSAASAERRARNFVAPPGYDDATPPPERSALAQMRDRPPPRPPGVIAVNPSTDAKAVLARVLAEPVTEERPRRHERDPAVVAAERKRDREREHKRAKRRGLVILRAAAASAAARRKSVGPRPFGSGRRDETELAPR